MRQRPDVPALHGFGVPLDNPQMPVDSPHVPLRRRLLAAPGGLTMLCAAPVFAADAFEWRRWPAGKAVPALEGTLADGSPWRLPAWRGHVVLANFWATWCVPCRDEMPSLARLAAEQRGSGLRVIGVNYRESAATVKRFFDRLGLELPTLLDADGELAAVFTPRIFPSTVVFDRQGRPLGTVVGEIDWTGAAAEQILRPLLTGA